MARPLGSPKLGGRQKGTPNKRTTVLDELLGLGKNPVDEILKLLPKVDTDKQLDAWVKMMSYCYPRFASVDIAAGVAVKVVTAGNVAELCKIARESIANESTNAAE